MGFNLGAGELTNFKVGSDDINAIYFGTANVWTRYSGPASPITITSSQTLTAGIDFPANTDITVDVVGAGGGGGGSDTGHDARGTGGYRGSSNVGTIVNLPSGTAVVTTVGSGGAGRNYYNRPGTGGTSSFGEYASASGGAPSSYSSNTYFYTGNGGSYVSPVNGSTYTDGITRSVQFAGTVYGGQAGALGNGGTCPPALQASDFGSPGGVGAGGSGCSRPTRNDSRGGNGGRGQINLSWSE